jgi:hypothetical protein
MSDPVPVLVGYLVTHADGWQVRMPADKARADLYAAKQHAVIEPLFVLRHPPQSDGEEIGHAGANQATSAGNAKGAPGYA